VLFFRIFPAFFYKEGGGLDDPNQTQAFTGLNKTTFISNKSLEIIF